MDPLIRLLFLLRHIAGRFVPRAWKRSFHKAHVRYTAQTVPLAVPVENYFGAAHSKRALLSYVTGPFLGGELDSHSNRREALAIASCFDSMGYCVDVVAYDSDRDIDYSRYSCIFGLGDPLERSFYQDVPGLIRIHYATGRHVFFQNPATLERARAVYAQKGVWLLDSCRVVPKTWSAQTTLPDAMVVIGNQPVLDTYRAQFPGPILPQTPSVYASLPLDALQEKNFAEAKRSFLYFSSSGAVHKGLDLLLQFFSERPELTLHIAAPLNREVGFTRVFAQELASLNIKLHGFINVHSEFFCRLMRECSFAVLPSCSEGMATSLLNVMCNGLIPVLTPECGLNARPYMVFIDAPDDVSVQKAVDFCLSLSVEEIEGRSRMCLEETRKSYSLEVFQKQMKENLAQICFSRENH